MNIRPKGSLSDIDKCMAGKCMGAFCPCLCHTSLKYDHDHGVPFARSARALGRRKRAVSRPRVRLRDAKAS
jgi:hypothetical protein